MGLDLALAHVDGLLEAVDQAVVAHIADDRQLLPLGLILDEVQLDLLTEPVEAHQLSLPDIHHIDGLVCAGAQGQLMHALPAQDEGGLLDLAPLVAHLLLVAEGDDVGIPQVLVDGQIEGGGLQCALDDGHGGLVEGLLEILVCIDHTDQGGHKLRCPLAQQLIEPAPQLLTVQDAVHQLVHALLLGCGLHLLPLGLLLNDSSCHIQAPFTSNCR